MQKHVTTLQWTYGEEKEQEQGPNFFIQDCNPSQRLFCPSAVSYFLKQDIDLDRRWKIRNDGNIFRKKEKKKNFIFIFSPFACWNSKDHDWAELNGRQICTASLSKKSHLQFCITQMSFSFCLYLNLKIYSILFTLQESYTNDPFLNTCKVFPHLDTKYLIINV